MDSVNRLRLTSLEQMLHEVGRHGAVLESGTLFALSHNGSTAPAVYSFADGSTATVTKARGKKQPFTAT